MRPDVTSEGVGTTSASSWHAQGWDGAGTDVAVVDVGFAGYAARLGTELPAGTTTDFSRCSGTGTDVHGTAVAEIVHDMAPAATIRLVCIRTEADFVDALADFQGLGIEVVNGSIGLVGSTRSDGSGGANTAQGAVRALRSQGILYVASAGNYGGSHWHGAAAGDAPSAPNVNLGDLVNITADDELGFVVGPSGSVTVTLVWDDWVRAEPDLDLYVFNPTCTPTFDSVHRERGAAGVEPVHPAGRDRPVHATASAASRTTRSTSTASRLGHAAASTSSSTATSAPWSADHLEHGRAGLVGVAS